MAETILEKIKFWAPTWAAWLPIQLAGLYAIYALAVNPLPEFWWVYSIIGYLLFSLVGVAICYHRYLSHRSFKTSKFWERILLWCGIMSGQGSPIFWAIIHRGYHHRLADTDGDPHSPKHGFFHSYMGWLFKIKPAMNPKYILHLIKNDRVAYAHRHYFLILWISNLIIFAISPDIWLWGVMFPCFVAFHCYALNTSLNHYTWLGYRRYDTKDNSTNVFLIWPFLLGDAWHNNHHAQAGASNFSRAWWELDPASWIIKLIKSD